MIYGFRHLKEELMKKTFVLLCIVIGISSISFSQDKLLIGTWKSVPELVDDKGGTAMLTLETNWKSLSVMEFYFSIEYRSPYFEKKRVFKGKIHLATVGETLILETLPTTDSSAEQLFDFVNTKYFLVSQHSTHKIFSYLPGKLSNLDGEYIISKIIIDRSGDQLIFEQGVQKCGIKGPVPLCIGVALLAKSARFRMSRIR